ncbi:YbhB/YbcL family Raf kinase inhibitor-like protein, partial [Candidatus Saccharibacteria bacterium]|nr:YbhB/YbcL family Raf kinase inhibitor-like protein [Candidatus Saccharibacteria bacterium]
MKLSSPAFDDNALIPKQYSRLGGDVSPPLEIGDVPNGAASLALVCHDPD